VARFDLARIFYGCGS